MLSFFQKNNNRTKLRAELESSAATNLKRIADGIFLLKYPGWVVYISLNDGVRLDFGENADLWDGKKMRTMAATYENVGNLAMHFVGNKSKIYVVASSKNHSGTEVIKLADRLNKIFHIRVCTLHDRSTVKYLNSYTELSLLSIFVKGRTWYEKFGFERDKKHDNVLHKPTREIIDFALTTDNDNMTTLAKMLEKTGDKFFINAAKKVMKEKYGPFYLRDLFSLNAQYYYEGIGLALFLFRVSLIDHKKKYKLPTK